MVKIIKHPVRASTRPRMAASNLAMQIYPSISTRASQSETSDTGEDAWTDTDSVHSATDLEAGLVAGDTTRSTPRSSMSSATRIGLCVSALLFFLIKYKIGHFSVLFLAWFFGITNADIIWWVHVVSYVFDTLFGLFRIDCVVQQFKEGKLVMPESGLELMVVAGESVCCLAGSGGSLLVLAASPVMAGFMVWSALMWCLSGLGWVFSSLGLL